MIRLSSTILLTLACWAGSLHGQTRFSFAEGKEYHPSFGRLRDTLFVLDSSYLEVRLDRQMILHHFRSGRIDTYPCSTGTPTITDGIATRPGIFSVQSKAKKTMSQEFQVYLNYWMGFDGGIGFHGLDGRSYYRFLGKRPSSHGCIRIANETGARLFGSVRTGSVVYVHNGSPARIIAFGDTSLPGLRVMQDGDEDLLANRLAGVMTGQWGDSTLRERIALPPGKRLSRKISVGFVDARKVNQYHLPIIGIPVTVAPPKPDMEPRRLFPAISLVQRSQMEG